MAPVCPGEAGPFHPDRGDPPQPRDAGREILHSCRGLAPHLFPEPGAALGPRRPAAAVPRPTRTTARPAPGSARSAARDRDRPARPTHAGLRAASPSSQWAAKPSSDRVARTRVSDRGATRCGDADSGTAVSRGSARPHRITPLNSGFRITAARLQTTIRVFGHIGSSGVTLPVGSCLSDAAGHFGSIHRTPLERGLLCTK